MTRLRRCPGGDLGLEPEERRLELGERLMDPRRLMDLRSESRPAKCEERACPLLSVDCSQLPMVSSTPSSSISLGRCVGA